MSPKGQHSDRILITATAALLMITIGFVAWAMLRLDLQERKLVERDLEVAQQLMRVRIAGMVYELEKQLRQEAASLSSGPDQVDGARTVERWKALLGDHWMIARVSLADEYGNETALLKTEGGLHLTRTDAGGPIGNSTGPDRDEKAEQDLLAENGTDTLDSDPRKQLWFSKALEDFHNEPAWNVMIDSENGQARIQIALLIRNADGDGPFRILMFEVRPTDSAWLQNRSTPIKDHGFLVMDGEGHLLNKYPDSADAPLSLAMDEAVRNWTNKRPRYGFDVQHMDKAFTALLSPYALNGQTLYTGVVLDRSTTVAYVQPERMALRILFMLLIALGLTLGMLWWQRRASIRRIRAQERYSRSQELQLAKAIGEREVLNREVHHRVKNNLQVVSSLLNLQASGLDDGPLRDEFLRGKQRIDSIALVHHKLYGLKDLRSVDLDAFITSLADALATVYQPKSHTVICDVRTNGIRIDQDTAIGLGIILCELVANAYQHAFPYATGGHIDIEVMNVEGDLHRMVMKDNGVGLDAQTVTSSSKLGLEIVEAMAEQLDGSFHTRSSEGSTFEILFRVKPVAVSAHTVAPYPDGLKESAAGL
jgi:two-component sensor histidine kinase